MTTKDMNMDLALAHKRYMKLLWYTLTAFLVSLLIGGIGAYMIFNSLNEGDNIPFIILLTPALITVAVTCIPIGIMRKKWFPTKELLMAAAKYKTTEK